MTQLTTIFHRLWPHSSDALPVPSLGTIPNHAGMTPADLNQALAKQENHMSDSTNKFIGFLEAVGKDFMKGLTFAVKYVVPVGSMVSLLFPPAAAGVAETSTALSLIQNAVILVEQKYAASGVQDGTGAQKAAEVLTLVESAVASLLAKAGITADAAYVSKLIAAVVGILNAQNAPAGA